MSQSFSTQIDRLFCTNSIPALRRAALGIFLELGFRRVAYVHSATGQPTRFFIDQIGFPARFVASYLTSSHQLADPFPWISRQTAFPVVWSDFGGRPDLAKRHRIYLQELRDQNIGDGLSVSVAGPNGRDGYFALGFGRYGVRMPARDRARLQLICQAAHNCLCELTPQNPVHALSLSQRETQVLWWITKGKSNAVIADILGLSPHTVGTLCKRLFSKLKVNDRVSAALVGLRTSAVPHNASVST